MKHKGLKVVIIFEGRDAAGKEEAASLDRISNGRLVLGIGAGWNVEEMRNHGTPFESRWEILRERVLAMREIWTKDRYLYPSHRERKTSGT